jgi:drug/metabolite transporter (DMT)-like permease
VESSAQQRSEYEFTTLRIVLLVITMTLWVLLALAATARDADSSAETSIGYFIGSLLFPLLIAWIVRSLYRMVRRRPVIHPAWTPGLFTGAVILMVLQAAGNSAPPS